MNIASFSIKRPIVIASIVILMIVTGIISINRLGMDLFPDVEIPFVVVQTYYPGAGPEEVEEQISKPIESEISSIAGVKTVNSRSQEGYSVVWGEFDYDVDIKYCEQQVRDKVGRVRKNFPDGVQEPVIERWNVDRDPVIRLALTADLADTDLYDYANEKVKPLLEQIDGVGNVSISGGVRKEVHVELDRSALNKFKISASAVLNRLKSGGVNVPVGQYESGSTELSYRSVGKYTGIREIEDSVIYFSGDAANSVRVKSLGSVKYTAADRKTAAFFYNRPDKGVVEKNAEGKPCLFIDIYKQSGYNTVKVADSVVAKNAKINTLFAQKPGSPKLTVIRDASNYIRINIDEVELSIVLGIIFAVIIVYLFLGNVRSTIITGIAIPNSLLGGFILMYVMGFTMNVMTLLALSLTVGLLIDDAIVVRENIFRRLEEGLPPDEASEKGTREVMMAVIATTVTVIAVFLPVAFMTGVVGRFFKQFGLTIIFAMSVSLFDALAVAPLLSTYFSGKISHKVNPLVKAFDRLQNAIDRWYEKIMRYSLKRPWMVITAAFAVFIVSLASLIFVPKTFIPQTDDREFKISCELPAQYGLQGTISEMKKIQRMIIDVPEVQRLALMAGTTEGKSNRAVFYVTLVPEKQRSRTNAAVKTELRSKLKGQFEWMRPLLSEYSVSGNPFPFVLTIEGDDLDGMQVYSEKVLSSLKGIRELTDVNSQFEAGKKEYQIVFDKERMGQLGITPGIAGAELRYHIEGGKAGTISENGIEYDLKIRLRPDQRDISAGFADTRIPNINNMMVPLPAIAQLKESRAPAVISRQNRRRIITISANIAPGAALGTAVDRVNLMSLNELKPPAGITTKLTGENDQMNELGTNIRMALILSVVFIFLVLASLYGSFITPVTILLALPPALSGAFLALALTGKTLDIYSMIGLVMLMGLVTKNSILLVDFAVKGVQSGMTRNEAILRAGQLRLRPILMTTLAMLAGTLPVALGLGEASRGRMSMGIAIIGGIILSTILTLLVTPAVFSYIDAFREKIETPFSMSSVYQRFGFGKHGEAPVVKKSGKKK